jgi:hypothetical protein
MHDAHHCMPLLFHCFQDHHNCQNSKPCGEMRPNTMGTQIDFSHLWGRWVDDHPQEDLAKFGYRSERKVEMFRNYVIFWWYARIYCPNMAISEIKSNSCNVELWAIFSKITLHICHIGLFFGHQDVKNKSTDWWELYMLPPDPDSTPPNWFGFLR